MDYLELLILGIWTTLFGGVIIILFLLVIYFLHWLFCRDRSKYILLLILGVILCGGIRPVLMIWDVCEEAIVVEENVKYTWYAEAQGGSDRIQVKNEAGDSFRLGGIFSHKFPAGESEGTVVYAKRSKVILAFIPKEGAEPQGWIWTGSEWIEEPEEIPHITLDTGPGF